MTAAINRGHLGGNITAKAARHVGVAEAAACRQTSLVAA